MNYDGLILAAVVSELRATIAGGQVQKVRQHNDTDVTLEIRGQGHSYMLFLSADAKFPRVYLSASAGPVPQQALNFCMVLRKYIDGARVASVEQVGFDRILRIHIISHEFGECVLILEIMGKHSNLILTNAEGKILGAAKHVGASVSRYRQVLPGREYLPPPGTDKIDPTTLDAAEFERLWSAAFPIPATKDAAREWLMTTFSGFGPFLAEEIAKRAAEEDVVTSLKLRDEMLALGEMVRASSYSPVFITGERGQSMMAYPIPTVQFPTDRQHSRASINEALDALFRSLVTHAALEEERGQVLTAIRRAYASRKQATKSIQRTLAESEKADGYRQTGELLLASIHAIPKGEKSVQLVDYFDPDMKETEVELDEKLSPQQNAERYFKRYQKARDAVATATARSERVEREMSLLESARQEAEAAKAVEPLKVLRKSLVQQDLLRQEIVQEKQVELFGGFRIRHFYTPEGWEILYGESSEANDHLTQRIARPNDIWLHARSITGAHVVIRTAGHSGGVPRPVLNQAAIVAAKNSEAKHSSLVPIDHTLRKYVRKPRGSAPGFVTYRNEKTIDVNPKAAV